MRRETHTQINIDETRTRTEITYVGKRKCAVTMDGLRAEGRSPYVGLRDSLRTAEKKCGAVNNFWGPKFFWGESKKLFGGRTP